MEDVVERLQRYGLKSRQHLGRVRLSHWLGLKTLSGSSTDGLDRELVQLSFDGAGSDELLKKLPAELHEIHLVALKANFELYLNRAATVAWSSRLNRLTREPFHYRKELATFLNESRLSREELIDALTSGQPDGAQELLVDKIVPRQGLEALAHCLELATEVSLKHRMKENRDARGWSQIAVAFQVRHLIEHRDGNADPTFRKAVAQHWQGSTWRRMPVTEVKKVTVDECDVTATFDAMLRATDLLTRQLTAWCSSAKA